MKDFTGIDHSSLNLSKFNFEAEISKERTGLNGSKKDKLRQEHNGKCERCKVEIFHKPFEQFHHKSFDRSKGTDTKDFKYLCANCHIQEHWEYRIANADKKKTKGKKKEFSMFGDLKMPKL